MAVSSLVLAVAAGLFTTTLRQNRFAAAKTTSGSDARVGIEAVARDLRVAVAPSSTVPAVELATPTQVTFFTSRGVSTAASDPAITKVWYWIDSSARCLRRATAPATLAAGAYGPAARPTGACVAPGDINVDGSAVFTYFRRVTAAVPTPTALPLTAGSVAAADLPQVASVQITLKVTARADKTVPPTEIRHQVTLANVTNDLQRKGIN